MTTTATILIPDISGFTEFLTKTEISHSSHIINELLEGIIAQNRLGFHLSEVEGDAVLFYKKGEAVPHEALVEQCRDMYRNFHLQLKIIERDAICRCGACSGASRLTLKFIAHFGTLMEINVAGFVKGTGADMIVAHRLLKNDIEKHEYLLLSEPYTAAGGFSEQQNGLRWDSGSEEYSSIGKVDYRFCYLDGLRQNIPDPPPPPLPPEPAPGTRSISIDLEVPMFVAYQHLVDTDKRSIWVKGMTKLERQPEPERAGSTHFCLTDGVGLDHTAVASFFGNTEMTYIERVFVRRLRMTVFDHYKVEHLGEGRSRLSLRFAFYKNNWLTRLVERVVLKNVSRDFVEFKKMCEG